MSFKIGPKRVGSGAPCFIIAEAGSNHDGRLSQALNLIDVAAAAGADAVKFQNFRAATLYPREEKVPAYLKRLGLKDSIYRLIEKMEMPLQWLPKLAAHAKRRRILFMSTPFDEALADAMDRFVPAYKIASYELTHAPLLRHVAKKRKPVILSTGAADMREIAAAVKLLKRIPHALMQCTARYPAPDSAINIRAVSTLAERFRVPVGLSDHSLDPVAAPVAAVALGAAIIEKHFTLSRRLKGPDHSYALEPGELKALVAAVRRAEAMLGDGVKAPDPAERELREYRRGLFTLRPVARGERFTPENAAVLRRAGRKQTDLPPAGWDWLLSRRARRALPACRLLSRRDAR